METEHAPVNFDKIKHLHRQYFHSRNANDSRTCIQTSPGENQKTSTPAKPQQGVEVRLANGPRGLGFS